MARTIDIPSQAYTPGEYGPFEINGLGGADNGFELTLTREAWPVGLVVTVRIEISEDGTTWKPWIVAPMAGGEILGRDGQPLLVARVSGTWPGENDGSGGRRKVRQQKVRMLATVAQALTTAITMDPI
jgi:hypothetical protein